MIQVFFVRSARRDPWILRRIWVVSAWRHWSFRNCVRVLITVEGANHYPIHVVWGIPQGESGPAVLVTAYRPDPERWNDDFVERRKWKRKLLNTFMKDNRYLRIRASHHRLPVFGQKASRVEYTQKTLACLHKHLFLSVFFRHGIALFLVAEEPVRPDGRPFVFGNLEGGCRKTFQLLPFDFPICRLRAGS